jgi:predicted ATP-dependent protease
MPVAPLSHEVLRPRGFGVEVAFETTAELEDLEGPFGHARAAEALRFGLSLARGGYNVYAMGPPGVGKHALVRRMLERVAADAPTPSDWCYLNDFAEPRRPRAVELPPGRGATLRKDLDLLTGELGAAIPAAFEGREYRTRLQLLEKEAEEAREKAVAEVQREAAARGVALLSTPMGFGFAPTKDGQVVEPDQFATFDEAVRERFRRDVEELQGRLLEVLRAMPDLARRARERVKALQREVALAAVGHLLAELRLRYADLPEVLAHLDAIQDDVVENLRELVGGDGGGDVASQVRAALGEAPALRRYAANLMVDHAGRHGAPVVHEDLPTLPNLTGRIDHHAHFGALVTDFTLVRPGALHRANGGFLLLDARRLLSQPFAWEALKRALRSREIRVEPPERLLGFGGSSTLEPQPIPLDVKVVLVGDRLAWHLLSLLDEEFSQLFKVAADFDDDVARSPSTDRDFARLVATLARQDGLRPLERAAVERVLHQATRLAGDSTRFTTETASLHDLLREADHLAGAADRAVVAAEDVRRAVAGQERRDGRVRDEVQEEIRRGLLVVETAGARVGQVNGLSVLRAGRRAFGRPSRISARIRLGRGEVVDIEREVELGGPLHSKGVLILAGYLGARYSPDRPLTLAATVVLEQSYAGVEGDSASSAELYALLSAIAGVPLRQGLAVTGSVDQHGRVQAVGGVTEKVEGFFEVCRARGLTGAEGVLLPAANVAHLVLSDEVLAEVEAGRFRLYPVEHVDQGIELLTGLPAGAAEGAVSAEGTFHARVEARLQALAEAARSWSGGRRRGAEPPRAVDEPSGDG